MQLMLYLQHCLVVESHATVETTAFSKNFSSFKVKELKWPEPNSVRDFIAKNVERKDVKTG